MAHFPERDQAALWADSGHRRLLLRLLISIRPGSILAAYVAVSIMIVLVSFYYYWEDCRIDQRYGTSPYHCTAGGGWTFFSPLSLILFVPLSVSTTLVTLRLIRWHTSATLQRRVIFALTTVSEVSLIMTMLGSFFGASMDDYHAGKQCGGWVDGIPPEIEPYCNNAREISNLSGTLLPIQVAFCFAGIVLSYLYYRCY
jgi:hypothetical protein